jgi:hypothetical protein
MGDAGFELARTGLVGWLAGLIRVDGDGALLATVRTFGHLASGIIMGQRTDQLS